MSLSFFRDALTAKLQERVDAAAGRAINMRVHADSRVDGYALLQTDTLAEARTYAEAAKIVIEEYKRLTETTQSIDSPKLDKPTKQGDNSIYG